MESNDIHSHLCQVLPIYLGHPENNIRHHGHPSTGILSNLPDLIVSAYVQHIYS